MTMQRRIGRNSATVAALIVVIVASGLADSLPWWFFVLPVLLLGIVSRWKGWVVPGFPLGFTAGFLVWFGGNLFYGFVFGGAVLQKIGSNYSLPGFVMLLLSGLPGGILAGLAFYAGKRMFRPAKSDNVKTFRDEIKAGFD
jgi:hypothetical protein